MFIKINSTTTGYSIFSSSVKDVAIVFILHVLSLINGRA